MHANIVQIYIFAYTKFPPTALCIILYIPRITCTHTHTCFHCERRANSIAGIASATGELEFPGINLNLSLSALLISLSLYIRCCSSLFDAAHASEQRRLLSGAIDRVARNLSPLQHTEAVYRRSHEWLSVPNMEEREKRELEKFLANRACSRGKVK